VLEIELFGQAFALGPFARTGRANEQHVHFGHLTATRSMPQPFQLNLRKASEALFEVTDDNRYPVATG
jgi:hypothetical protein